MKKLLLVLIILLLLGGGGYYYFASHQQKSEKGESAQNPFTSIRDALNKSLSLQCSFTDEQDRQTTVYVKAGAVRVNSIAKDSSADNGQMAVIMKDDTLYEWDLVKKQGMMMKLGQPTVSATGTPSQQSSGSKESSGNAKSNDVLATIEKYKNSCKPAVVDSALFIQPRDVKFSDVSQLMQIPLTGAPSGTPSSVTSSPNQEQINQMIQQYKNQMPPASSDQ